MWRAGLMCYSHIMMSQIPLQPPINTLSAPFNQYRDVSRHTLIPKGETIPLCLLYSCSDLLFPHTFMQNKQAFYTKPKPHGLSDQLKADHYTELNQSHPQEVLNCNHP